jgi:hypothetical protein
MVGHKPQAHLKNEHYPKTLGKIIEPKLMHLFFNVLISEQHGFLRAKSTVISTLVFYSYLIDIVLLGGQVDAT